MAPSLLDQDSLAMRQVKHDAKTIERPQSVLQKVKRRSTFAVDCQTYRLFDRSSQYDDSVSIHIARIVV